MIRRLRLDEGLIWLSKLRKYSTTFISSSAAFAAAAAAEEDEEEEGEAAVIEDDSRNRFGLRFPEEEEEAEPPRESRDNLCLF